MARKWSLGALQPQDRDLLIKYKPTDNITNPFLLQIEYYITMSVSNVLILSTVNPDVVGGWGKQLSCFLSLSSLEQTDTKYMCIICIIRCCLTKTISIG